MTVVTGARPVRAPRGATLSCRGWGQEAALRMLMNNLDPEVAERPDDLVVYGGSGRAVRSWEAFDAIVRELRRLADDETLLVQSGKPVGVLRTHEWAPRVLIANSNLVGRWANWDTFRELERKGLTMYGQMTAGSGIYIGTQGILQGTFETFAELARQHFGGSLRGRVVLTAGLGGMGGAQPLAVTMNDGVALVVEVDEARARRRQEIGYVDRLTHSPDEALGWARAAASAGRAESIALVGNAAQVLPEFVRRGERFDVVTDQTSAHDALNGYVPAGVSVEAAEALRRLDPDGYVGRAMASMADHVRAMLALQSGGAVTFDYGNNIRAHRRPPASPMRSTSRASSRPSSGRSSARARGRSAGRRCRAIRRTFCGRTAPSWNCSRRTPRSGAGSRWPRRACRSRGCPRGSAGWGMASGRGRVPRSTNWCVSGRWARRS